MDLFSLAVFAMTIPAVIFAGISKGGFGSGVAFASASILALVLDPGVALGLMLPLLMLIDFASLPAYWRKWDWPTSRILMLGGVPGTFLGALFYAVAEPDLIRLLIGLVCIGFLMWQALTHFYPDTLKGKRMGPVAGISAGMGMGFTSFVSHAGGPVAAVYLLGQNLSKTRYQATTVLVFWIMNLLKTVLYAGMGIFTADTLLMSLALAPFAILGTWLGIKAHHMLPEHIFFGVTYVALGITGTRLIWVALS